MGVAAELSRQARKAAGLTMAELADLAGTSKPTVSRYENGLVDPGVETLNRLLQACGRELRAVSVGLPTTLEDVRTRFANQAEPTADDVSRTCDGRELRTADQLEDFIAELRSDGLLAG
jgi:transcriptional regulator with XRE-family HTH domain